MLFQNSPLSIKKTSNPPPSSSHTPPSQALDVEEASLIIPRASKDFILNAPQTAYSPFIKQTINEREVGQKAVISSTFHAIAIKDKFAAENNIAAAGNNMVDEGQEDPYPINYLAIIAFLVSCFLISLGLAALTKWLRED